MVRLHGEKLPEDLGGLVELALLFERGGQLEGTSGCPGWLSNT